MLDFVSHAIHCSSMSGLKSASSDKMINRDSYTGKGFWKTKNPASFVAKVANNHFSTAKLGIFVIINI